MGETGLKIQEVVGETVIKREEVMGIKRDDVMGDKMRGSDGDKGRVSGILDTHFHSSMLPAMGQVEKE